MSDYSAGLRFVVSTPAQPSRKPDRRAIGRHVRRATARRPQRGAAAPTAELGSWIDSKRGLSSCFQATGSHPMRVGSDFSGLQLPPGVEPLMIQQLVALIKYNMFGGYPYEICLDVHPVDRGWFPYMISDACCLHSLMFATRAYLSGPDKVRGLENPAAAYHYGRTLQLLQERIDSFGHGTNIITDPVMMVVIMLSEAAEFIGDYAAATNHITGLCKMVDIQGGLRKLATHNNMQVKVCRADLGFALRNGYRPFLLQKNIDWDCFVADRGMINCSHASHAVDIDAFARRLDPKLRNAWKDMHAFSCLSNLAAQTTKKLSPALFNEMMVSILYRLANLSYPGDTVMEAVRTGLLAFATTLFLQRYFMKSSFHSLASQFRAALQRLFDSQAIDDVPTPVVLWLVFMSRVLGSEDEHVVENWQRDQMDGAVRRLHLDTWDEANDVLRSVMWVRFVHDESGAVVFEESRSRLSKQASK